MQKNRLDRLEQTVLFKVTIVCLTMLFFSCDEKRTHTEQLLLTQYDEMDSFYKKESFNIYLAAKDKTIDFPYLKQSFDSINNIKNELDVFFMTYPDLKEEEKLDVILKTRKKISSLTKLKIKFIDENLLMEINGKVLDKGINADFSRVYYDIMSDYYSNHCNKVH